MLEPKNRRRNAARAFVHSKRGRYPMPQTENSIIIQKIKKILSLAESTNENEAALASARVLELLDKYNLSLAEVEETAPESADPITEDSFKVSGSAEVAFFGHLANVFDCIPFARLESKKSKNGNWYRKRTSCVVGHRRDIEVLSYTYDYLRKTMRKLYTTERERWLGECGLRPPPKHFQNLHRQSYTRGFGERVSARIEQSRKERLGQGTREATATQALVHQRQQKVTRWIRENMDDMRPGRRRSARVHLDGYQRGLEAGDTVSLREGLEGEEQERRLFKKAGGDKE